LHEDSFSGTITTPVCGGAAALRKARHDHPEHHRQIRDHPEGWWFAGGLEIPGTMTLERIRTLAVR